MSIAGIAHFSDAFDSLAIAFVLPVLVGVGEVAHGLPLLQRLQEFGVLRLVHQRIELRRVGNPQLQEPALSCRVLVDGAGRCFDVRIDGGGRYLLHDHLQTFSGRRRSLFCG